MERPKICVFVQTQEEWNKVIRTIRPKDYYNSFDSYYQSCIDISDGCHCSKDWFIEHNYTIISYEDWINDAYADVKALPLLRPVLINVPKI